MKDGGDHHPGKGLAESVVGVPVWEGPAENSLRPVEPQWEVDEQHVSGEEDLSVEQHSVKEEGRRDEARAGDAQGLALLVGRHARPPVLC